MSLSLILLTCAIFYDDILIVGCSIFLGMCVAESLRNRHHQRNNIDIVSSSGGATAISTEQFIRNISIKCNIGLEERTKLIGDLMSLKKSGHLKNT